MKNLIIIALCVLFIGCAKDSFNHDVDIDNSTTNNYGTGTNNGANNNGEPQTPLTLLNVKVGGYIFWGGDTNAHVTTPIQNRPKINIKRVFPLPLTWETTQAVRTHVDARITDYQYNQKEYSTASISNFHGSKGSLKFDRDLVPGDYILTISITLIDPGNEHYSRKYSYIYPICIVQ